MIVANNNYCISTRQIAEMLPGMGMGFSTHSILQRRRASICGFPLPTTGSFSELPSSSKALHVSGLGISTTCSGGGDDFWRVASMEVSRTIATQTPTEDLHFIFPDPPMEDDSQDPTSSTEELTQVSDEPDVLEASPKYRRRSNSLCVPTSGVTPSTSSNVPRTNAVQIPFVTRRTLTHSVSCSSGVKETSSVGQELRSIGDDLDRIGGRPTVNKGRKFSFS